MIKICYEVIKQQGTVKGQPIISSFMSSDYKTKITPFYIQCISPELDAM